MSTRNERHWRLGDRPGTTGAEFAQKAGNVKCQKGAVTMRKKTSIDKGLGNMQKGTNFKQ